MKARLYRYGHEPNSHDLLKVLATLLMVLDHIGLYFLPKVTLLRMLGRGAAPLFFYAFGNFKPGRNIGTLLVMGLILSFTYPPFNHSIYFNILINFALLHLILNMTYETGLDDTSLRLLILFAIIFNPVIKPYLEYGTCGMLFALGSQLSSRKDERAKVVLLIALVSYSFYQLLTYFNQMDTFDAGIFYIIMLLIGYIMLNYKQRTWQVPQPIALPLLVISRYSLMIYFWHLLAFRIINHWSG